YEAEMLTRDEWSTRFLAPAGITGLWQVSKRDQPDMSAEERIDLDIEYARNYSIWTDLIIILRTFRAVVQHGEC
ncbi:MAG: sugar transferase, partial [Saprospiraceae bacterium]|nr:sugar transferase [Saprospiraceae bacterium]